MNAIIFDTHDYIKKFREKGLSEDLAEYQIEVMKSMVNQAISQTKHDFDLENVVTNKSLDARIKETELKIELVRSELKREIAESKADLTRYIVTAGILQTAIIAALVLKLAGH